MGHNPDVGLPPLPQTNATGTISPDEAVARYIATSKPDNLVTALAKAQGAFTNVAFDRVNPHFKSRYASLAANLNMTRKPLSQNGLCITQTVKYDRENGDVMLVTTLYCGSETIESVLPLPDPRKVKPQEFGSALTYLRRYVRASLLDVSSDEDDDGNVAQAAAQQAAKISEDQFNELTDLIKEQAAALTGVSLVSYHDRYLAHLAKLLKMDLSGVQDIPASEFAKAKQELLRKRS